MPHEGQVRAWLRGCRVSPEDIDDLIQESYCSLASLETVDRIDRPGAYFFSVARNLLLTRLRRSSVVPLATVAELEALHDQAPSPEREVAGRLEYGRVDALIAELGEPCSSVVRMRKVEGRSQRDIAQALGITEGMVEWHVHNGIKSILKRMRREEGDIEEMIARGDDSRERQA